MRTITITLPNGIPESTGTVIRDIEIRKLTGEDEDMLLDRENLRKGGVIDRLLKNCIVAIGPYTKKEEIDRVYDSSLLLADVTYILVQLRIWGISPIYSFEHSCPRCEHINKQRLDLTTLKIDQQKEDFRGKSQFMDVIDSTDDTGKPIKVPISHRPLFTKDSRMMEAIKSEYPREKATRELMIQLVEFNGAPVTFKQLQALDMGFRNQLRKCMDDKMGGINLELLMTCRKCERTYKENMPIEIRSFFFRAEDSSDTEQTAIPYHANTSTSSFLVAESDGAPAK